jgi:hypothetical protein
LNILSSINQAENLKQRQTSTFSNNQPSQPVYKSNFNSLKRTRNYKLTIFFLVLSLALAIISTSDFPTTARATLFIKIDPKTVHFNDTERSGNPGDGHGDESLVSTIIP